MTPSPSHTTPDAPPRSRARRPRRRTAFDRMPPALLFAGALATSLTTIGGLAVLSVL